jgi:aryl-alcohol dehydrogenase-like predicted oxidoreductase
MAEDILGKAIKGRRDKVLISTKGSFGVGPTPNDVGSSRHYLPRAIDASLRRLGIDYIDLYQLHAFDAMTPIEEAVSTLDDLVRAGKIRYIGCSNFSGWHLMKSLAISEERPHRYVAHQAYYSLIGREFEWELMRAALDQGGTVVESAWWGRLTVRFAEASLCPRPAVSKQADGGCGIPVADDYLYKVMTRSTPLLRNWENCPRLLNWLLQRPSITVIIGARNEEQLH